MCDQLKVSNNFTLLQPPLLPSINEINMSPIKKNEIIDFNNSIDNEIEKLNLSQIDRPTPKKRDINSSILSTNESLIESANNSIIIENDDELPQQKRQKQK